MSFASRALAGLGRAGARAASLARVNAGRLLRSRLNDSLTPGDLAALGAVVKRELEADERVETATPTITFAAGALRVAARITTAAGPFRLVLAVGAVTAEILATEPV